MAATTSDIRHDIESLTTRIESTAEELDSRLARLPRLAAWAWRHKRVLVVLNTVLLGALWLLGTTRHPAPDDSIAGSYQLTIARH